MQARIRSSKDKIGALCLIEEVPFTQNEHYFFSYRNNLCSRYKALFRESRGEASLIDALGRYNDHDAFTRDPEFWEDINIILARLATRGIHGVQAIDLAKLLPSDSMDPAIEIMAEVRAYFQGGLYSSDLSHY